MRAGIQRFAWGRLDEYPINDLFNPWDYTQFILKPLQDRRIGIPAISASTATGGGTYRLVWAPWFVPYRLSKLGERWAFFESTALSSIPNIEAVPPQPDLPARTFGNGSVGFRAEWTGEIEFAANFFHGFDTRPVFRTTVLRIIPSNEKLTVDPGIVPSFHRITTVGLDVSTVKDDWSIRAEAAYEINRAFNTKKEF